jgi:uncharacterized protein YegL/uncharacterized protein YneF (UPF0154 family)
MFMSRLLRFFIVLPISFIGLIPLIGFAESAAVAVTAPNDVRILVDVSGSMKKTDPQNLRKPAVDLILRLLPDKSKASLWTFGDSVNALVPYRHIDEKWRELAALQVKQINSTSLFTNLGVVLERATEDAKTPIKENRPHIILLTDGVVDISKEAVENVKERRRILNEIVPQLKTAGFRIHTIALSNDADQELLKNLSLSTDAIAEVATSAEELMPIFLRIFDQAAPAERVPLDEKGFLVDASIQEFTALIFRRAGVAETLLISPDGKKYKHTDLGQDNINWYRTDTYDLITVQKPSVGRWQLETETTPDSRVTVVSNLQLIVEPLKTQIATGDILELVFSFRESDQLLTNKDFLKLLTNQVGISAQHTPEVEMVSITQDALKEGVFRSSITASQQPGLFTLKLMIDGNTFKREYVHQFSVNPHTSLAENHSEASSQSALFSSSVASSSSESSSDETTTASTSSLATIDEIKTDETAVEQTEDTEKEEKEEVKDEEKSYLWLYVTIGIVNLLLLASGYFIYRKLFGKNKKENNEGTEESVKDTSEKKSKEKIEETENETKTQEEKQEDNPFPLDNMEDSSDNQNKQ